MSDELGRHWERCKKCGAFGLCEDYLQCIECGYDPEDESVPAEDDSEAAEDLGEPDWSKHEEEFYIKYINAKQKQFN